MAAKTPSAAINRNERDARRRESVLGLEIVFLHECDSTLPFKHTALGSRSVLSYSEPAHRPKFPKIGALETALTLDRDLVQRKWGLMSGRAIWAAVFHKRGG